jgi:methionyl aminopeptidase
MVEIKSQREIDMMKFPAEILVKTMNTLKDMIAPGVRTIDLDRKAAEVIKKNNGRAAFLGYGAPEKPFPASICASVNEQVVHGIPGNYELKEGDIIGIDLGVEKNGFYSDACYTFAVGKVSKEVKKLLTVTENSLYQALTGTSKIAKLTEVLLCRLKELKEFRKLSFLESRVPLLKR